MQLLQPTIESMGFELWGIELVSPGKRPTLRIYIDADDGVSIDHCAQVSHQVSGVLDVENPINGEYTLEVSSPGVDRLRFVRNITPLMRARWWTFGSGCR